MCRPPNSQKRKEIWKGVLDSWPLRLLFAAPAIDRVFDANAALVDKNYLKKLNGELFKLRKNG